MISYKLDHNGIFRVKLEGPVEMSAIVDYLDRFKTFTHLPDPLLLLYDLCEASLRITAMDIIQISELGSKSTEAYTPVKTAFVVQEGYHATYAYLFSEKPSHPRIVRKVFPSMEKAESWLLIGNSPQEENSAHLRKFMKDR